MGTATASMESDNRSWPYPSTTPAACCSEPSELPGDGRPGLPAQGAPHFRDHVPGHRQAAAATVCLLYLTSRGLGFGHFASALSALALGLGTFVWHYSRTFMSEPTSMLAASLTFYALLRYTRMPRVRWLLVSGGAAGLAVLLRTSNIAVVAPMGLWLLWELRSLHDPRLPRAPLHAIIWAAPVGLAVAVVGLYNLARFGSVLESGYGKEALAFTTPLHVGLYGFLLSPGESMFVYAPILVTGLAGWFLLRRTHATIAVVLACNVVPYVLFYAKYYMWSGGGVWGPRFLVVILPFCLVGLAALIQKGMGRVGWAVVAALGAVSVFIQVVSVLVPYIPYEAKMEATPELFDRLLWNPAYSPVLAETASLLRREYPLDIAARHYAIPALAWTQLGALGAAAVTFVLGLLTIRQSLHRRQTVAAQNVAADTSAPSGIT